MYHKKGQSSLEAMLAIMIITFFIVSILYIINDKNKFLREKKEFIDENEDCVKLSSVISEISSIPNIKINLTVKNNFEIYSDQLIEVGNVLCGIRPKTKRNLTIGGFEKGVIEIEKIKGNITIKNV